MDKFLGVPEDAGRRALLFYSRIFLGVVFVMASLGKIADAKGFAVIVGDYRILPDALVRPFSYAVPWVELFCGIFILFGVRLRATGWVMLGLLSAFLFAMALALVRGQRMDCGCFGFPLFGSTEIGWGTLLRNVVLIGMTLPTVIFGGKDSEGA